MEVSISFTMKPFWSSAVPGIVLFQIKKETSISQGFFTFMPATGIEPVLYRYNRILSPARLPVPPRGQIWNYVSVCDRNEMGRGGFEPPKQYAADLQSVPFGHSGICPFIQHTDVYCKADDRTRTDNLLITNQLLCQLSHIGICNLE